MNTDKNGTILEENQLVRVRVESEDIIGFVTLIDNVFDVIGIFHNNNTTFISNSLSKFIEVIKMVEFDDDLIKVEPDDIIAYDSSDEGYRYVITNVVYSSEEDNFITVCNVETGINSQLDMNCIDTIYKVS